MRLRRTYIGLLAVLMVVVLAFAGAADRLVTLVSVGAVEALRTSNIVTGLTAVVWSLDRALISAVAVVFGTIWTVVIFYHLYPFVQFLLDRRLDGSVDVYAGSEPNDPTEQPVIDVLLPAYQEGDVIHQAIGSIRRAEYPQRSININVLVEPDDEDTRAALVDLEDRYDFQERSSRQGHTGWTIRRHGRSGRLRLRR